MQRQQKVYLICEICKWYPFFMGHPVVHKKGIRWISYYKNDMRRIYFDSYGQITPLEIQRNSTKFNGHSTKFNEIQRNSTVIQYETDFRFTLVPVP